MCSRSAVRWGLAVAVHSVLCSASPSNAAGNLNKRLVGEYDSTITSTCLVATQGFNDDLSINGDALSMTNTAQGVTTYDGMGAYEFQGTSLVVLHAPTAIPPRVWDVKCEGEYEVAADLSFVQEGSCVLSRTEDGEPPTTVTINGISRQGRILRAARGFMLQLSDTDGGVETYSNGYERICTGSGTALKIK